MDLLYLVYGIMAIYGFALIFISLIFNSLVCFICLKSEQLRATSTFKFLAIGAINDILMCFAWNFVDFWHYFFGGPLLYMQNLFFCKIINLFLMYSTITYGSWIYVSISLDRVLSLNIKKWTNTYFKGLRPVIYAALLAILVIGLNIINTFKGGYILRGENGTDVVICFKDSDNSTVVDYVTSKV
jgi:hypothetical protein